MSLSSAERFGKGTTPLVCIIGVALAARLLLIFGYGTVNAVELFEYDAIARNILAGDGYVYRHLGTPYRAFFSGVPYIWMTTALYTLFPPGPGAVMVVQSVCSALLAVTVWAIGRRVWSHEVGVLGALLVAAHPGLGYYDTHKLHPLSFDALTIAASVFMLLRLRDSPAASPALLAGMILGAAFLERGTVALLIVFAAGWIWGLRRYRVRRIIAMTIGVVLVVTPWIGRNYATFGSVVMTTTAAENFWRGNVPGSAGSTHLPSGRTVLDFAPPEFKQALRSTDEVGQMRLFWSRALADVAADPWRFAVGVGHKLTIFWSFAPQFGILYPSWYSWAYLVYYLPLAAAAVLGCVVFVRSHGVHRDSGASFAVIAVAAGSVSLMQSLFYVDLRHRWGIEPLVLVLSAVGIVHALSRARGRQPRLAEAAR